MKSILKDLYDGKLHPDEQMSPDAEYRQLSRELSGAMEVCRKKFSETDFKLLEEVLDLYRASHSIHTKASFIQGYRMGALTMVEVFTGANETGREKI